MAPSDPTLSSTVPNKSASERYYEGKLRGQRNRGIARAGCTAACCGIPCLVLSLILAVGMVLLGLLLL